MIHRDNLAFQILGITERREAKIDIAVAHQRNAGLGDRIGQRKLNVRVTLSEPGKYLGHPPGRDRRQRRDRDTAPAARRAIAKHLDDVGEVGIKLMRERLEHFAIWRQFDPSRGSIEKLRAQRMLERRYPRTEGGLREPAARRRAREIPLLRESEKDLKVVARYIHGTDQSS
jgi:hypothetical protein